MSERVTHFCLCDSLWSCTQSDGYTRDIVSSPSQLPFLFSHSQGPELVHPQQSDNPLICISGSPEDPVEALDSRVFC